MTENGGMKKAADPNGQKLFARGKEAVRRLNGHPNTADVLTIQQCGIQLLYLQTKSPKDFEKLPRAKKQAVRGSISSALAQKDLSSNKVFGEFERFLGFCNNPLNVDVDRQALARFFEYFASSKLP